MPKRSPRVRAAATAQRSGPKTGRSVTVRTASDEQGERSLDNALPWDHIKAARFEPYGLGSLADLDQRHRKRIEDDPGFRYLVQEYALAKEIREQKTISLNEASGTVARRRGGTTRTRSAPS